jgi:hypothetical protein
LRGRDARVKRKTFVSMGGQMRKILARVIKNIKEKPSNEGIDI